jgi:predicted DNA-binding protein
MSKGTTRKSISVRGLTYQRLKEHADSTGQSVSGYLEKIIDEKLTKLRVPPETVLRARVTNGDRFTF